MTDEPAGGAVLEALLAGEAMPPRPGASVRRDQPVDWSWSSDAACRDTSDDEASRMVEATELDDARDLLADWCATCSVALRCLAAGRATRATGVWGGTVLVDGAVAGRGRPLSQARGMGPTTAAGVRWAELLTARLGELLTIRCGSWTGAPGQLVDALRDLASEIPSTAGSPGMLSRALTDAADYLSAAGIEVERRPGTPSRWTVRRVDSAEAAQAS